MKWIDDLNKSELKLLSPYARRIFTALRPILGKFDLNKLDNQSKIEILKHEKQGTLHIDVVPQNRDVFGINLYASATQCILGYCYSEQIECHSQPEEHVQFLEREILKAFENYLQGITVIQHYNHRGKIFKTINYWGIDGENSEDNLIGTNALLFSSFSKTERTKKITCDFKK